VGLGGVAPRVSCSWAGRSGPTTPACDTDQKLSAGQSEQICPAFLIPAGQKSTAVELPQGHYKEPWEWPAKG
jgi:hypothetical protein